MIDDKTQEVYQLKNKLEQYEKKYGPLIEKRGMHNVKNLWRKPTGQEWLTLFMLAMILAMAYFYQHDVAVCKEYVKSFVANFSNFNSSTVGVSNYSPVDLPLNISIGT